MCKNLGNQKLMHYFFTVKFKLQFFTLKLSSTMAQNGHSKKLLGWHLSPAQMLICGYLRTYDVRIDDIAKIILQYCQLHWIAHMAIWSRNKEYVTVRQQPVINKDSCALLARYIYQPNNNIEPNDKGCNPFYKAPIIIKPDLNQLEHSGNHRMNILLKNHCCWIIYSFEFGVLLFDKNVINSDKDLDVELLIRSEMNNPCPITMYELFKRLNHTIGSSRMGVILESVRFEGKKQFRNSPVKYTVKQQICKSDQNWLGEPHSKCNFKIDQSQSINVAFSFTDQFDHRKGNLLSNWDLMYESVSDLKTYYCKHINIRLNLSKYVGFAVFGSTSCECPNGKGFEFTLSLI